MKCDACLQKIIEDSKDDHCVWYSKIELHFCYKCNRRWLKIHRAIVPLFKKEPYGLLDKFAEAFAFYWRVAGK